MNDTLFELKNIEKIYNPKKVPFTALENISFKIDMGESIAIVGKSGSGKSTLMHIMAGLLKPTNGEVIFKGSNISKLNKNKISEIRNKNFGFIFQQFHLIPRESVLENVALQLKIKGIKKKRREENAKEALVKVDLMDKIKNKATDLSGGQKQRVAIARAIVANPDVIFADEPTGNLDSKTSEIIEDFLFDLNKKGKTLIVVTHDEDLAKKCSRIIKIKDGKIIN